MAVRGASERCKNNAGGLFSTSWEPTGGGEPLPCIGLKNRLEWPACSWGVRNFNQSRQARIVQTG